MTSTPSLRWEWKLANGARIAAELDTAANREIVIVGSCVVSEAGRATKPEGHTVVAAGEPGAGPDEPIEAVLRFEPNAPICVLRVEGFEVAPSLWPVRRKDTAEPPRSPFGPWPLVAAAVAIVGIGVALAFARSSASANGDQELSSSHRAANGLFIAHYPPVFKTRPAVLPPPLSGILLEDEAARATIIVAAVALDETIAADRWVVQQRFHDEVLANLPKVARTYVQVDRREETCLNEPGAVVAGRFDRPDGAHAKVWSCAFVKEGRGYFVLYVLPETSSDARLRRIVEGTELTRLAGLGPSP